MLAAPVLAQTAAAIYLGEHGAGLRESFLIPAVQRKLPQRLANKYSMYEMCRNLGVPCAASLLPSSADEAHSFAAAVGLPLVVKVACAWPRGPNSTLPSTSIVRTREQLLRRYEQCEREVGSVPMLQEHIPAARAGHPQDWFFHGYCNARSECAPAFTGIKGRSFPPHFGMTSFGRWVDNPELREQVGDVLRRLSYPGIVDLDLRWDERHGRYKLLDFNPRVGAQFRLFEDRVRHVTRMCVRVAAQGRAVRGGPAPLPLGQPTAPCGDRPREPVAYPTSRQIVAGSAGTLSGRHVRRSNREKER